MCVYVCEVLYNSITCVRRVKIQNWPFTKEPFLLSVITAPPSPPAPPKAPHLPVPRPMPPSVHPGVLNSFLAVQRKSTLTAWPRAPSSRASFRYPAISFDSLSGGRIHHPPLIPTTQPLIKQREHPFHLCQPRDQKPKQNN